MKQSMILELQEKMFMEYFKGFSKRKVNVGLARRINETLNNRAVKGPWQWVRTCAREGLR